MLRCMARIRSITASRDIFDCLAISSKVGVSDTGEVMAAYRLCQKDADPSLTIRNKAPKGRSTIFNEGEAVRLAKRAIRMGFNGLACIIAVAWDTSFSPIDCRLLAQRNSLRDREGLFFVKLREKTKEADDNVIEAIGTLSKRSNA